MTKSDAESDLRPIAYWQPGKHLSRTKPLHHSSEKTALLILNQPIKDIGTFRRLWNNSTYKICADGGANRLYELLDSSSQPLKRNDYLPDEICGDLDSIYENVREYYSRFPQVVQITKDPDQYSTDFTKCLQKIKQRLGAPQERPPEVIVLGGLGGRVDQALSTIHHLYAALQNDQEHIQMQLYTDESVSFMLAEGKNIIQLFDIESGSPVMDILLRRNVGILPIGRPARITTKGLEWDVSDWLTEFGGQVSTSNHIVSDTVEIQSTERVLFTVERVDELPA